MDETDASFRLLPLDFEDSLTLDSRPPVDSDSTAKTREVAFSSFVDERLVEVDDLETPSLSQHPLDASSTHATRPLESEATSLLQNPLSGSGGEDPFSIGESLSQHPLSSFDERDLKIVAQSVTDLRQRDKDVPFSDGDAVATPDSPLPKKPLWHSTPFLAHDFPEIAKIQTRPPPLALSRDDSPVVSVENLGVSLTGNRAATPITTPSVENVKLLEEKSEASCSSRASSDSLAKRVSALLAESEKNAADRNGLHEETPKRDRASLGILARPSNVTLRESSIRGSMPKLGEDEFVEIELLPKYDSEPNVSWVRQENESVKERSPLMDRSQRRQRVRDHLERRPSWEINGLGEEAHLENFDEEDDDESESDDSKEDESDKNSKSSSPKALEAKTSSDSQEEARPSTKSVSSTDYNSLPEHISADRARVLAKVTPTKATSKSLEVSSSRESLTSDLDGKQNLEPPAIEVISPSSDSRSSYYEIGINTKLANRASLSGSASLELAAQSALSHCTEYMDLPMTVPADLLSPSSGMSEDTIVTTVRAVTIPEPQQQLSSSAEEPPPKNLSDDKIELLVDVDESNLPPNQDDDDEDEEDVLEDSISKKVKKLLTISVSADHSNGDYYSPAPKPYTSYDSLSQSVSVPMGSSSSRTSSVSHTSTRSVADSLSERIQLLLKKTEYIDGLAVRSRSEGGEGAMDEPFHDLAKKSASEREVSRKSTEVLFSDLRKGVAFSVDNFVAKEKSSKPTRIVWKEPEEESKPGSFPETSTSSLKHASNRYFSTSFKKSFRSTSDGYRSITRETAPLKIIHDPVELRESRHFEQQNFRPIKATPSPGKTPLCSSQPNLPSSRAYRNVAREIEQVEIAATFSSRRGLIKGTFEMGSGDEKSLRYQDFDSKPVCNSMERMYSPRPAKLSARREGSVISDAGTCTTVESTHAGSDDAQAPEFDPEILGSREKSSMEATSPGIYGTRKSKSILVTPSDEETKIYKENSNKCESGLDGATEDSKKTTSAKSPETQKDYSLDEEYAFKPLEDSVLSDASFAIPDKPVRPPTLIPNSESAPADLYMICGDRKINEGIKSESNFSLPKTLLEKDVRFRENLKDFSKTPLSSTKSALTGNESEASLPILASKVDAGFVDRDRKSGGEIDRPPVSVSRLPMTEIIVNPVVTNGGAGDGPWIGKAVQKQKVDKATSNPALALKRMEKSEKNRRILKKSGETIKKTKVLRGKELEDTLKSMQSLIGNLGNLSGGDQKLIVDGNDEANRGCQLSNPVDVVDNPGNPEDPRDLSKRHSLSSSSSSSSKMEKTVIHKKVRKEDDSREKESNGKDDKRVAYEGDKGDDKESNKSDENHNHERKSNENDEKESGEKEKVVTVPDKLSFVENESKNGSGESDSDDSPPDTTRYELPSPKPAIYSLAAQDAEPPSNRLCISGLPSETSAGLVQRMHRVMRHLDKVEGSDDLPENLNEMWNRYQSLQKATRAARSTASVVPASTLISLLNCIDDPAKHVVRRHQAVVKDRRQAEKARDRGRAAEKDHRKPWRSTAVVGERVARRIKDSTTTTLTTTATTASLSSITVTEDTRRDDTEADVPSLAEDAPRRTGVNEKPTLKRLMEKIELQKMLYEREKARAAKRREKLKLLMEWKEKRDLKPDPSLSKNHKDGVNSSATRRSSPDKRKRSPPKPTATSSRISEAPLDSPSVPAASKPRFICPSCGFRLANRATVCDCAPNAAASRRGDSRIPGVVGATEPHSECARESLERKVPHGVAWFAPSAITGHQLCPCCDCCPCRHSPPSTRKSSSASSFQPLNNVVTLAEAFASKKQTFIENSRNRVAILKSTRESAKPPPGPRIPKAPPPNNHRLCQPFSHQHHLVERRGRRATRPTDEADKENSGGYCVGHCEKKSGRKETTTKTPSVYRKKILAEGKKRREEEKKRAETMRTNKLRADAFKEKLLERVLNEAAKGKLKEPRASGKCRTCGGIKRN